MGRPHRHGLDTLGPTLVALHELPSHAKLRGADGVRERSASLLSSLTDALNLRTSQLRALVAGIDLTPVYR